MGKQHLIEQAGDDHGVIEFLEDRLYEHNSRMTGRDDGRLFSLVIRGGDKVIIAGVAGWTWAGACEITQLWVGEAARAKGLGKLLLEAAEVEARSRGCRVVLARSYSFQAPGFYERQGYRREHIIEGFPAGHRYYFLMKELN